MRKNIYITGGLGYLGGRVSHFLSLNPNYNVTALTRTPEKYHKENFTFSIKRIDSDNLASLNEIFSNANVVIHFAAMNEVDAAKDPELALLQTGEYTGRILNALPQEEDIQFINISTARVYTNPFSENVREDSQTNPEHPYGKAHLKAEQITKEWGIKNKNLTISNLRLSNCFGAPLTPSVNRWSLLINELCKSTVTDNRMILKSPGLQRRDFMTITDLCRAILHFLSLDTKIVNQQDFNIGSGWTPRIREVAQLIKDRAETVLNTKPSLVIPESEEPKQDLTLKYNCDKFLATGYQVQNNYIKEIDEMLTFCKRSFPL